MLFLFVVVLSHKISKVLLIIDQIRFGEGLAREPDVGLDLWLLLF